MTLFSGWKHVTPPDFASSKSRQRAEAVKELDKRRGRSATYTQPLRGLTVHEDEDVQSFLTEFYGRWIFERAHDMQRLLRDYPDTVATHYALLVPDTVSFDQFWSRYYYRCSVTTVLQEWQRQESEALALRQTVSHTLVPTIRTQFLKQEIERGLGSRVDSTASTTPTKGSSLLEEKMAARASIFHTEADSDIVETLYEGDEKEENEDQAAFGIGFAASG